MNPAPVVVVLSTGRCGTQWLTATLGELAPELRAEHEPIGAAYAPRRHFRQYDAPGRVLDEPRAAEHLAWIDALEQPYVETGWPLFAALPWMAERWPDRLRVVHLTRHPVPSALSHLAHSSYAGSGREDEYTQLATLAPDDPGVVQADYRPRWEALSGYERCLFWWTEVHRFGLEFAERYPSVPLLRVRSESMLGGDAATLRELAGFLGLGWDPRWIAAAGRTVDRWHHHTDRPIDPLRVHRHPLTVEVAQELGYDLSTLDIDALLARYRGAPHDPARERV